MTLTIKFFGLLVEITGCTDEQLNTSAKTVEDLLGELYMKYPELKLKEFQVAQNNTIVKKTEILNQTEIALLPPFSGG